ncbi:537_t:CDS:2, partial [Cetraspora pellucida]
LALDTVRKFMANGRQCPKSKPLIGQSKNSPITHTNSKLPKEKEELVSVTENN